MRAVIRLAMIATALALALDLAYFVRGSLEELPTVEDHEKVRLVTGAIAVLLALVEAGLWALLKIGRRATA